MPFGGSRLELDHRQVHFLYPLARPRRLAQEGQARFDGWIIVEALDSDATTKGGPAIVVDQSLKHLFECDSMKWIARLFWYG